MVRHLIPSVGLLVVATAVATLPASAQAPLLKPATFPAYQPSPHFGDAGLVVPVPTPRPAGERVKHAAIGGVFGAVAGVATCTILSITLFGGTGCAPKGNLQFGVGGFLLGAGIGAVL